MMPCSFEWRPGLRRAVLLCVLSMCWWPAAVSSAATVTDLQAAFRKGQTFVTFREVTGTGITYSVYRSSSPITSVNGLTPIAVLSQGTGTNRYTAKGFVITDLGTPLTAGTGLLVYTPAQNGTFYYAVTNSADSGIVQGVNASAGVSETVWQTPGAVQIRAPYQDQGNWVYEYFAWEDFASWDPAWGHYGSRFDVVTQLTLAAGQTYPLTLKLHGAGQTAYREPDHYVFPATGVYVFPVDLGFLFGNTDPYTGSGRAYSNWFGYVRRTPTPEIAVNVTERRALRYVRFVAGESRFQVDQSRVYVSGASMGGGGSLHVALHNPTVFAATEAIIGWVDMDAWGDWSSFRNNPPVNSPTGPLFNNWQDSAWVVRNYSNVLPPIIHTFRKDDNIISNAHYPALLQTSEQYRTAHVSVWQNGGHSSFSVGGAASYLRFRKNEAYPAFAQASNSTAFDAQTGQRNQFLDWSSSLRSFGAGTEIVDTVNSFAMSFKSLSSDATASVTIRNTQQFLPRPGTAVAWTNRGSTGQVLESGTGIADAAGVVTVSIRIPVAGNRLTLSCGSCSTTLPPAAPTNVRIVR